jgi:hypothetical protein
MVIMYLSKFSRHVSVNSLYYLIENINGYNNATFKMKG